MQKEYLQSIAQCIAEGKAGLAAYYADKHIAMYKRITVADIQYIAEEARTVKTLV